MIYITGDTHIPIDIRKLNTTNFPQGKSLTKNDYVIITGDFGLLWFYEPDKEEIYWKKWLNEKPFTILFIDGNHENHDRLAELPIIEKFGGKVGVVSDSIFYLKRGEIYTIESKTFFCMGGAKSVDDASRIEGVSIWRNEIPSYKEMDYAITNLEIHGNKVDYIIAHTLPQGMIAKFMIASGVDIIEMDDHDYSKYLDPTAKFLDEVCNRIQFKKYFCGHFHANVVIDNFTILYEDIIEI